MPLSPTFFIWKVGHFGVFLILTQKPPVGPLPLDQTGWPLLLNSLCLQAAPALDSVA